MKSNGKIEPGFHEGLDVGLIDPSPYQNRVFGKGWGKLDATQELVSSIREIGVQQPVVGRPHPKKPDRIELVCGERRLRASRLAGKLGIPIMVKDLTDQDAASITVVENNQREDLSPLEEAKGVKTMLEVYGDDTKAVAAQMGKSEKWVRLRNRLNDLSPKWLKAIAPGGDYESWSVGHLELVARFPTDVQEDIFKTCHFWENEKIDRLSSRLADYVSLLRKAPWDLSDELLVPSVVACNVCQKRSDCSQQLGLWDEKKDSATWDARCLDRNCWNLKARKYLKARNTELKKTHKKLLYLDNCDSGRASHGQRQQLEKTFKNILRSHAVKSVKKSTRGALPALVVNGPGLGSIRWVKRETYGYSPTGRAKKDKPTLKELRAKHKEKRAVLLREFVVHKLEASLGKASKVANFPDVGGDVVMPPLPLILGLACVVGVDTEPSWQQKGVARWERVQSLSRTAEVADEIRKDLWPLVSSYLVTEIGDCFYDREDMGFVEPLAEALGLDIAAMRKSVHEQLPEPDAWKNLNADGTPKKQPAKATKKKAKKKTGKTGCIAQRKPVAKKKTITKAKTTKGATS